MGLAVGTGTDAVHRCRTLCRNLVGHYLLDGHTVVATHHKLDIRQRSHFVGIRQTVQ